MPSSVAWTVPPRTSAGYAPPRVPGSVRRTSTIDMSWPEGLSGRMLLQARARDAFTPLAGGAPVVLAEDAFEAWLGRDRTVLAIESDPPRPALAGLVGKRGGGGLRRALQETVPEERARATPLYLILDDMAGASLVSAWAFSQWDPDWLEAARSRITPEQLEKLTSSRRGVCIGHAPGSSAEDPFRASQSSEGAPTPDLRNPADPEGWHAYPTSDGCAMRRARRIDVRLGDQILIDSAFQDSATTPAGGRAVVHEYRLEATADPKTLELLTLRAEPRVLPFVECPGAAANVTRLLGAPLTELREKVLVELAGTAGCTHLNDALRALAEVPALVRRLEEAGALARA